VTVCSRSTYPKVLPGIIPALELEVRVTVNDNILYEDDIFLMLVYTQLSKFFSPLEAGK